MSRANARQRADEQGRWRGTLRRFGGILAALTVVVGLVAPTALSDEPRRVIANGVTDTGGLLVDPAGRIWVSDAVRGFCRVSESSGSTGSIEAGTCLGGNSGNAGPARPGAPALVDPTPQSAGSGDEVVLIPDAAAGSSRIVRARWSSGRFTYFSTLSIFGDGDLRPVAVTTAPDRSAYVVFDRTRSIVRIVDPAVEQPTLRTVGFTAALGARGIAAGTADSAGRVLLYIAEAGGFMEYRAPANGYGSGTATNSQFWLGAMARVYFDPATQVLYAGSASTSGPGGDVIHRVDTRTAQVTANWATGYSRIGGLATRQSLVIAADDEGLVSSPVRTGVGSVYTVGEADTTPPAPPVIVSPASGSTVPPTFPLTITAEAGATLSCSIDGGTASVCTSGQTLSIPAAGSHTLRVTAADRAGNVSQPTTSTFTVDPSLRPQNKTHDFSGDGNADVIALDGAGGIWLYRGNGAGGWLGWDRVATDGAVINTVVTPGDWNGDGNADFLARDTSGGLWLYAGDGTGAFAARTLIGSGWNGMTALLGPGDWNGDGNPDVLARDSGGGLWLYPGNGAGGWLAWAQIGSGWNPMTAMLGPGDWDGDGRLDVLARDSGGGLWLYRGNGTGGWLGWAQIGNGWSPMTAMIAPGDWNGDALPDVLARDGSGGLWLYRGNGTGGWLGWAQIGSGWGGMRIIA